MAFDKASFAAYGAADHLPHVASAAFILFPFSSPLLVKLSSLGEKGRGEI